MKYQNFLSGLLVIFCIWFFSFCGTDQQKTAQKKDQSEQKEKKDSQVENDSVYRAITDMPDQREIYQHVRDCMSYPKRAEQEGVEGKVYAQFVVGTEGEIRDIEILKSLGYGCDEEVKRVLKVIPKVSPGTLKGEPVPVQMQLPIRFKLMDEGK